MRNKKPHFLALLTSAALAPIAPANASGPELDYTRYNGPVAFDCTGTVPGAPLQVASLKTTKDGRNMVYQQLEVAKWNPLTTKPAADAPDNFVLTEVEATNGQRKMKISGLRTSPQNNRFSATAKLYWDSGIPDSVPFPNARFYTYSNSNKGGGTFVDHVDLKCAFKL